jgi:uncharacterized protein (DUF885 family)
MSRLDKDPPPAHAGNVDLLVNDYFEQLLALSPSLASSIGDYRFDDRLENSAGRAYFEQRRALAERFLAQVKHVRVAALDENDRLTYDFFVDRLEREIDGARFRADLLPVDHIFSMPTVFAGWGSGTQSQRFTTVRDYEQFLARCDDFVVWVDTAVASMREGIRVGITHAQPVARRIAAPLRAIASDRAEESVFWQPIRTIPDSIGVSDRERLTALYRDKIDGNVLPAYRRLADFADQEYAPHARAGVGWSALPEGLEWYRYAVRRATTLDVSPDELHRTGLAEVARIRAEMDRVRLQVGFRGDLEQFMRFVETDLQFRFPSGAAMLEAYRDLKRQIDVRLPDLFSELPPVDYEIREMESFRAANSPGGQYERAAPDGSRPGIFYVNTHDLAALPTYIAETLSLHEASPGHHFQLAIEQVLTTLPLMRRVDQNSAYHEGWALYAESLGHELGLYTDPYQWYGHLTDEMLRAMRLVVDTGLHAKDWTREQAVQYMVANSSMSRHSVENEVDRYLAWPAQALSYKTGQRLISELRARAEQELGQRFDLRQFHRQLLNGGPLPLNVLEARMRRWIDDQR